MTIKKLQKIIRAARGENPVVSAVGGVERWSMFFPVESKKPMWRCAKIKSWDSVLIKAGKPWIVVIASFAQDSSTDISISKAPGFTLANLSPVLLPLGTTTLITDPHEIANVQGLTGIEFMLNNSAKLPLEIYFMAPSCVPPSHLETSGAILTEKDLRPLLRNPRVLGLAEMMNFPGVLLKDQEVLKKITAFQHKIKDGHAPLLTGEELCAYVSAGIISHHESTGLSEARA